VLLPNIYEQRYAATVGTKLLHTLNSPIDISGKTVWVSASIGISSYPKDGEK